MKQAFKWIKEHLSIGVELDDWSKIKDIHLTDNIKQILLKFRIKF